MRLIIDTDPGMGTPGADPEDGLAILLALNTPGVTVEAITLTHGNVPLSESLRNIRHLLDLAGRTEVPVHAGARGPMVPERRHLQTRWLARPLPEPPIPTGEPLTGHGADDDTALDAIIEAIGDSPEELTIVAIGPLTNIARVAERAPEMLRRLHRLVVMGGTVAVPGNITPAAEFNIWMDPEAAAIVFDCGVPITMVGLDVCHRTSFDRPAVDRLRDRGTPLATHVARSSTQWIDVREQLLGEHGGLHLYDTLAAAVAIDPTLVGCSEALVEVETSTGPAQGMTVSHTAPFMRALLTGREPNAAVAVEVDVDRFHRLVHERVLSAL